MIVVTLSIFASGDDSGVTKSIEVSHAGKIEIDPSLLANKSAGVAATTLAVQQLIREMDSERFAKSLYSKLKTLPSVESARLV